MILIGVYLCYFTVYPKLMNNSRNIEHIYNEIHNQAGMTGMICFNVWCR